MKKVKNEYYIATESYQQSMALNMTLLTEPQMTLRHYSNRQSRFIDLVPYIKQVHNELSNIIF